MDESDGSNAAVVMPALAFLDAAVRERDPAHVWLLMDEDFRRSLARFREHDPVNAERLVAAGPAHPDWPTVAEILITALDANLSGLDPDRWGVGAGVRPIGADLELLYLHPQARDWQPGEAREVVPIVMRYTDAWRVRWIGSEDVPANA